MFDHIISSYVLYFYDKGESVIQSIVNCKVPSEIVMMKYKTIPPIETMPLKEKEEMWLHMKETFPEKTKEELIDAAKIYYTIGSLL